MTRKAHDRHPHISVRLVWSFLRVMEVGPALFDLLAKSGVGPQDFANPETRIRATAVMELLGHAVESSGDPGLGLHAAEKFEPDDLGPLDGAARRCENLRQATLCVQRYFCLVNEAAVMRLEERHDEATWSYEPRPGIPHHPAANDFVVAFAVALAQRYAGVTEPNREVHLTHAEATDEAAYARVFRTTVKLGMPRNAIVFPRRWLDLPMVNANPLLQDRFEHLAPALSRAYEHDTISRRVRDVLREQLTNPTLGMELVARTVGMSVATLRRRLADEGTTLSQLLVQTKRELAAQYDDDPRRSTADVAFLLGYRNIKAFRRAHDRWGSAPAGVLGRRATKATRH